MKKRINLFCLLLLTSATYGQFTNPLGNAYAKRIRLDSPSISNTNLTHILQWNSINKELTAVPVSSFSFGTDLSIVQNASNVNINSSTGNDIVVQLGNGTNAGVSSNDFTNTEKTKLSGISTGAEVNVNADWNAISGDSEILNKPTIPTNTNQLTNGAGFITNSVLSPYLTIASASTTYQPIGSYLTSYTETDPVVRAINGIIKSNGTTITSAIAGTDYALPNSNTTGTASNITANTNTTLTSLPNLTDVIRTTGNQTKSGSLTFVDFLKKDVNYSTSISGGSFSIGEPTGGGFDFFKFESKSSTDFDAFGLASLFLNAEDGFIVFDRDSPSQNQNQITVEKNTGIVLASTSAGVAKSELRVNGSNFAQKGVTITSDASTQKLLTLSTDNLNSNQQVIIQSPTSSGKMAITSDLNAKQDLLLSGTNIKTINGNSILGSGNLTISGGGSSFDENNVTFFTDFSSITNTPWAGSAISSGTSVANSTNLTSNRIGVYRMTSSTTANGGYRWQNDTSSMFFKGDETFVVGINPQNFTTTTFRAGFLDSTSSADSTDGAYFEYSTNGNLVLKTANNSTRSVSPTITVLALNTWYKLKITVNSNATSILGEVFDSTGVLISSQTLTTNIPKVASRVFGSGIIATESTTTATAMVDVDFIKLTSTLTR